jgi:hypothetical protein
MREPSEGLMAYEAIAEELSSPEITLADLDQGHVRVARDYAKRSHRRWPPKPVTTGWTFQVFSIPQ